MIPSLDEQEFLLECLGGTVVDFAKDPCRMGSLARSTTENQDTTEY
jgi:hypothetical protein